MRWISAHIFSIGAQTFNQENFFKFNVYSFQPFVLTEIIIQWYVYYISCQGCQGRNTEEFIFFYFNPFSPFPKKKKVNKQVEDTIFSSYYFFNFLELCLEVGLWPTHSKPVHTIQEKIIRNPSNNYKLTFNILWGLLLWHKCLHISKNIKTILKWLIRVYCFSTLKR